MPPQWDAVDFVLGRFTAGEREALEAMLGRACDCLECWLDQGIQPAMNKFNGA